MRPISSRGKGRPVGSSSPRITAKSKTTRPHSCDSPQVSLSKTSSGSKLKMRVSLARPLNICLAPRLSCRVAGQPATQSTTWGRWWKRWASLGERARRTFNLGDRDALTLNQHQALMLLEEQDYHAFGPRLATVFQQQVGWGTCPDIHALTPLEGILGSCKDLPRDSSTKGGPGLIWSHCLCISFSSVFTIILCNFYNRLLCKAATSFFILCQIFLRGQLLQFSENFQL